jgi:hypothetical protein
MGAGYADAAFGVKRSMPCIALGLGISTRSEIRRNGLAGHWQAITGIVSA